MMNTMTGKTIVCGLIGDPVAHSVSPGMQNAVFTALGLDFIYIPFKVDKDHVPDAIKGMKALHLRGLNVTIPHKVSVMHYLDKIDSLAQKIGAVNTIVNDDGILTGYNTDAEGFIRPLLDRKIPLTGKKVLIIGAGGAARAVSFALMEQKAQIIIINRSLEKATELAQQLNSYFLTTITAFALNQENLVKILPSVEMLVNTTSIGMENDPEKTPIPGRLLTKNLIVYDIVYNPLQTRLLKEAGIAGAITIPGIEMLAWQGALAFEKWTGQKAPMEIMKNSAIRQLEHHED
jgi:shikimate dehydrogenase